MQRTILVKYKNILIKSQNSECYQCLGKQFTSNIARLQYALLRSQKKQVFFLFFPTYDQFNNCGTARLKTHKQISPEN